jgi:hypothetical protein
MPPRARVPGCFTFVWLVGWTFGTLIFNALLAAALFWQFHALTFLKADGVVTRSGVETEHGADGPIHRLAIRYEFQVDGKQYGGDRYCYAEMSVNSSAWKKLAAELPVGTRVTVYYDPDDPSESLLRPGLTGFHLWMIWFLTPFNAVLVGGWIFYRRACRPAFDPADPRTVSRTDTGYRVQLPMFPRIGVFCITVLVTTGIGMFVWGLGFGMNPPVWLAGWAYIVVIGFAVKVALMGATPVLEVDEIKRTVRLVRDEGEADWPFEAVAAVTVTHEVQTFEDVPDTHSYHCDLVRADQQALRLCTYSEPEPAEALAAWLRHILSGERGTRNAE